MVGWQTIRRYTRQKRLWSVFACALFALCYTMQRHYKRLLCDSHSCAHAGRASSDIQLVPPMGRSRAQLPRHRNTQRKAPRAGALSGVILRCLGLQVPLLTVLCSGKNYCGRSGLSFAWFQYRSDFPQSLCCAS